VIVPPLPGVFSAVGLLASGLEHHDVRSCQLKNDVLNPDEVAQRIDQMRTAMLRQFARESVSEDRVRFQASVDVRFVSEISDIRVPISDTQITAATLQAVRQGYEEEHQRLYGHRSEPGAAIEITAVRLIGREAQEQAFQITEVEMGPVEEVGSRWATFPGEQSAQEVSVVTRAALAQPSIGPLLVDEYDATIVIPPGWTAQLDDSYNIIMDAE
jgi:N-methylhydantoinase A